VVALEDGDGGGARVDGRCRKRVLQVPHEYCLYVSTSDRAVPKSGPGNGRCYCVAAAYLCDQIWRGQKMHLPRQSVAMRRMSGAQLPSLRLASDLLLLAWVYCCLLVRSMVDRGAMLISIWAEVRVTSSIRASRASTHRQDEAGAKLNMHPVLEPFKASQYWFLIDIRIDSKLLCVLIYSNSANASSYARPRVSFAC